MKCDVINDVKLFRTESVDISCYFGSTISNSDISDQISYNGREEFDTG